MRKKFILPILILGILSVLGAFSPVFGAKDAFAANLKAFPNKNLDYSKPNPQWQVNQTYLDLEQAGGWTTTTTKQQLQVSMKFCLGAGGDCPADQTSGDAAAPKDQDGGVVKDGRDTGGLQSIFNGSNPWTSTSSGIYLAIGTSTTDATDGENVAYKKVSDPVDYKLIKKADNSVLSDTDAPISDDIDKARSIGYYLLAENPAMFFAGKNAWNFNVNVDGLTAGKTYYAQVILIENNSNNEAFSNAFQFATPATDTAATAAEQFSNSQPPPAAQSTPDASASDILSNYTSCHWYNPFSWFTSCLIYAVYHIIYTLSALLLSLCGKLFDVFAAMSLSAHIYRDPSFITNGWRVVRDLANIFFIFIMMYIAIAMILQIHGADVKKMLAKVIIIALLVNFSLFFTRVVIDASNVLTRVFYNQIKVTTTGNPQILNSSATGIDEISISSGIVNGLDINRIISKETMDKISKPYTIKSPTATGLPLITVQPLGINDGVIFTILILGIITNLVACYIFLSMSMLFVLRILGLWFAMIFSPIALVSSIVPEMGKHLDQLGFQAWMENLIGMALMAPIFMFFMYLIVSFLNSNFLKGIVN